MRATWTCAVVIGISLLGACRSDQTASETAKGSVVSDAHRMPETPEDDPRVVKVGDRLYAKSNPSLPPQAEPQPKPTLGSGIPDESNGECRLYAPEYPEPTCCPIQYGFDAEWTRELCGAATYLGESFRDSCGYFFVTDLQDPQPVGPRMSFVSALDPKTAATDHAEVLRYRHQDESIREQPVPSVEGAYWVLTEKYGWAYIPGWKKVRRLSWARSFCGSNEDAGLRRITRLIERLAAVSEIPIDAPRTSLIPTGPIAKPSNASKQDTTPADPPN